MKRGPRTTKGKESALLNLVQNREPKQRQTDLHGTNSIQLAQPQTRQLAEQIKQQLADDGAGWIRDSDNITINLLALALRRIQQIDAYLDKVGSLTNAKGEVRPVLDLLTKLLKQAESLTSQLGLSPQSRVKLGVNVARGLSLGELLGGDTDSDTENSDVET